MAITVDDFQLRIKNLRCCIGTLGNKLLSKIRTRSNDLNCKLEELEVLCLIYKSVKCYKPLSDIEPIITEDDNCLTEDQLTTMLDYASSKCEQCFSIK